LSRAIASQTSYWRLNVVANRSRISVVAGQDVVESIDSGTVTVTFFAAGVNCLVAMRTVTRSSGTIHPDQPRMVAWVVSIDSPAAARMSENPAAALNAPWARAAGQTDSDRRRSHPKTAPTTIHMPIIMISPSQPGAPG